MNSGFDTWRAMLQALAGGPVIHPDRHAHLIGRRHQVADLVPTARPDTEQPNPSPGTENSAASETAPPAAAAAG